MRTKLVLASYCLGFTACLGVYGMTDLHADTLHAGSRVTAAAELHTQFEFTARVSLEAPIVIGEVPNGLRRYVPITGGSVEGARIKGSILRGGGDSQIVRSDAVLSVDATYFIQTDDGVRISVVNRGVRRGPAEVIARLARGEKVAASEYYFRTVAQFEAPVGSGYEWLNDSVFVATAEREASAAVVHFFRVL